IMTLIFYRFTFFKMTADELSPPYWINMGAVAITAMAGSRLLAESAESELLSELRPFLKGFTLFFWATATWWIPLLLILGDWRHIVKRVPFTYHPAYWSMVFPLGMYTAATFQLARALDLDFLYVIPEYFIYVALGSWAIVFAAMAIHIVASLNRVLPEKESVDKLSEERRRAGKVLAGAAGTDTGLAFAAAVVVLAAVAAAAVAVGGGRVARRRTVADDGAGGRTVRARRRGVRHPRRG